MNTLSKNVKRILCLVLISTLLYGCEDKVTLLKELSEMDANEVFAALLEHGIHAEKKREKAGIYVVISQSDMAKSVQILKAKGLPKRNQTNLGDVFKKEGIISTPLEERARYIYALSQELEFTLSQMDDVIVARVHVVLPERVAPGRPIQPSSAAVFIKHTPALDPDVMESRMRNMVISSIPGLHQAGSDKVAVTFVESNPLKNDVQWRLVGPFMVEQGSVSRVFITIGLLILLIISNIATMFFLLNERARLWLMAKIKTNKSVAPVV